MSRSVRHFHVLTLLVALLLGFGQRAVATNLIVPTTGGGFENAVPTGTPATDYTANGWTVVNGANNRLWVGTTATPSAGTYSAFSGVSAASFTGELVANVNHFYQDITFPAGETKIILTFKYKIPTSDATFDYLKLWLVPTSTTPVAGTQLSSGQIGLTAGYDAGASYTAVSITLPSSLAGTTQRLVFSWRTDGVAPNAAIAIDEISLTTAVPGNISSNAVAGNWSAPGTWVGGVVPDGGDNVTIVDGATVTIDMNPTVGTLTVGGGTSGILQYDQVSARTLTTLSNVTIAASATFKSSATGSTGTITTHALSVGGSLTNNGTLNFSTAAGTGGTTANAAGAGITFTGAADATFDVSNAASITNLRNTTGVTLNKGTSSSTLLNFLPATTYTSAAGATSSTTTITVGSTTGLAVGMFVSVTAGTGVFAANTTVTSITNATQFVVSTAPTTALSGGASVVTASKFGVLSASLLTGATAGFLTITNGTFKVGGSNVSSTPYFNAVSYSIPATGGFWMNNANATVTGHAGSPTMSGLLRMTAGTYNVGTASGNQMGSATTSSFIIEGGTMNFSGRLQITSSGAQFNMSAGVINVTTVGNASSATAGFGVTSATSVFTMSGGTINLVQRSTGATILDYFVNTTTPTITGGTLNVGAAATATNFNFGIQGAVPNLVIDNTTNPKTANLVGAVNAYGTTTINSSATLNLNGFTFTERSTPFTNNGTLTGTTTSSRLSFFSPTNTAQVFAGTGAVTAPLDGLSVQNTGGLTITHTNAFQTLRVNLFAGTITNSNKITLGSGAAAAVTVQIGAAGSTQVGGSFDVAPTFNLGTGNYGVLYLQETAARTTGLEIPATRTITSSTISNPNNVTVAGGALSIGTLTLQAGNLITTAANLVTVTGTATTSVVRSTYTSAAGATSSGTTVTVGSTTNLVVGMNVSVSAGVGAFAAGTTVTSITNATTFVVSATPTTALSGGASVVSGIGGWVNGPLQITLPASLVSGSTYVLPIGKGTYNSLELVNPTTNALGSVIVKAEAFDANSGGTAGLNMSALNTNRYWAASITAGAANFTNTLIKLTDASVVSTSAIAASALQGGVYNLEGGTSPTIVVGSSITTQAPASITLPGFYAIGTKAVNMAYVSSTTTQAVVTPVLTNTTNNQVIGVQVVTTGNASPLSMTSMTFNTTGTTNAATDITNAKVWYTGTSSTFATTTQFGSTNATPSGSYSITGTQVLAEGTNYFWLTYDVPTGATVNNLVDAECTSISPGSVQTPTVTAPAGTRTIKALLNGTYTIGPAQLYTTLTAAITDLNAFGVSGPVVLQLASNYVSTGETFPLTINAVTGGSATNTVTIRPASGASPTISGSSATGLIVLNGADYVTIGGSNAPVTNTCCPLVQSSRNMTIQNTNTGTSSAVIWLQTTAGADAATNNSVRNCVIRGNASTTTLFGIGMGSATISTTSLGTANNNNTIENNDIGACQHGIYTQGASAAAKNTGNSITLNQINSVSPNNVGITGILTGFENSLAISCNTISEVNGSSDRAAINLGWGTSYAGTTTTGNEVTNATITNNVIGNVVGSGTNTSYGICVASAASGTTLIANNMIRGVSHNSTSPDIAAGIALGGGAGSTTNVYHNTVSMQGTMAAGTAGSMATTGLAVTNATMGTIDVKNNIFTTTQVGNTSATTRFSAIGLTASTLTGFTSNYNDLISAGAGPGTYVLASTGGITGGTTYTFATWQSTAGQDAQGKNVAPVFLSTTDLHLNTSNASNITNLMTGGVTLASVPLDIDCATRSATPTIGADEFSVPACTGAPSAGTSSATTPATLCANSGTVSFTNNASNLFTGITYQWQVTTTSGSGYTDVVGGTGATTQNYTTATLTAPGTYYYVLRLRCGNVSIPTGDSYSNEVTVTVNPNPVITPAATNGGLICGTGSVTLSATSTIGGTTYGWNPGSLTGSPTVSPTTTTTYTVTGTTPATCTGTSTITVTVAPAVTASTVASGPVCIGTGATLTTTASPTSFTISGTNATSVAVPDASLTGATRTVALSGGFGTISAANTVSTTLSITTTFNGDIDAYLVGPGNCGTMELTTDNGSTGDNYAGVVLTTPGGGANINTVAAATNNISGTWSPEGTVTTAPALASGVSGGSYSLPATALAGCPVNGTWTLFVGDDVSGDPATITNFQLSISGALTGNYTMAVTGGTGTFGATSYSAANNSVGAIGVTNMPVGTNTYTVTTTAPSGCTTTSTASITVNPLPTATASGGGTVCSNQTLPNVTFTFTGTPPYSFTYSGPGGTTVTGHNSNTYVINNAAAGTYAVTAITDNNTCAGTNFGSSATVTVNPAATANAGGPYAVCGAVAVNISATANGAGTWSGGAGTFASATSTSTTYTPTAGEVGTTVTLTWTTTGTGSCPNVSSNASLVVNPLPTGSTSGGGTVCSTSSLPNVTFTFTGTGPWNYTYSGPAGAVSGTTSTSPITITNAAVGTYQLTALSDANCTGTSLGSSVNVAVQPAPNAGANTSVTYCSSSTTNDLAAALIGEDAGGTWPDGGPNYNATTMNPGVYRYVVAAIAPCAVNDTAFITVNEQVAPNAGTNGTLTICSNASSASLFAQLGGTPDAGGTWTGPSAVSGGMYNPATMNPGVYTYTVTGVAPCANATATVSVTENAAPVVTCPGNMVVSSTAPAFTLTGGSQGNSGVYSGPGVSGTGPYTFTPANANAGNNTITYTYTDVNGCSNSCTFTIGIGNTVLVLETDNNNDALSWEVRTTPGNTLAASGAGPYAAGTTYSLPFYLANGDYILSVFDAGGDGLCCMNGTGGFILRTAGGARFIDANNSGIFTNTASVALGFTLPMGANFNQLTSSRCDRENYMPSDYIQCGEDPAVTAQYGVTNSTSGYQFWIFDPNGGYSRRVTFTHANASTTFQAGPARCSFLRLNQLTTNPIPYNALLNVRVRSYVAGVYNNFGPACRIKVDLATNCPTSQLLNNVSDPRHSCGITGVMLNGSRTLHAVAVSGANKYQFEFVKSGYLRRITSSTSSLNLTVWYTLPLQYGFTYDVRVRVSFDNGVNYCPFGTICQITTASGPENPGHAMEPTVEGEGLQLWPNPNGEGRVYLHLDGLSESTELVTVDIYDLMGSKVQTATLVAGAGVLNGSIDLGNDIARGVYVVNLTADGAVFTKRLVVQ